jgi:molybdopterin synthase catalytic subunit
MIRCAIVTASIDPAVLLAEVTTRATGATTLFVGTVRDVNEGRAVTGIAYSAYSAMALEEMERIAHEAAQQFHGVRVAMEHRLGLLVLEEISVAIAVAHARRAPAMDASRFIIEEVKRRVPVWKQEHYVDGERVWIDPTAMSVPVPAA